MSVHGTNADLKGLDMARKGINPPGQVKKVKQDCLKEYLVKILIEMFNSITKITIMV